MKERDFQTLFSKRNTLTGVFELKFVNETKRKSLPFSDLKIHQEQSLVAAHTGEGLFHKISDQPIFAGNKTRFTRKKPFDCLYLKRIDAYVVIMWWLPREKKMVYYINIFD